MSCTRTNQTAWLCAYFSPASLLEGGQTHCIFHLLCSQNTDATLIDRSTTKLMYRLTEIKQECSVQHHLHAENPRIHKQPTEMTLFPFDCLPQLGCNKPAMYALEVSHPSCSRYYPPHSSPHPHTHLHTLHTHTHTQLHNTYTLHSPPGSSIHSRPEHTSHNRQLQASCTCDTAGNNLHYPK